MYCWTWKASGGQTDCKAKRALLQLLGVFFIHHFGSLHLGNPLPDNLASSASFPRRRNLSIDLQEQTLVDS
jgi:hypothetical protein